MIGRRTIELFETQGERMYRVITKVIAVWVALNFLIPAFIIYQRSPHFRHQLFRWMTGSFAYPRRRQLAHVLVDAARHHH